MSRPPATEPLLPGSLRQGRPATLGVMGGGQLGRMFVHAAQAMGYRTAVLDPDPDSPAGCVSHHLIRSAYDDPEGLARLADGCDAITTEFENVPAAALQALAERRPVAPGARAVAVAQDRAQEKAHFLRCGVPCAPHAVLRHESDLQQVPDALLPGILKTVRLGYDGRGQQRVDDRAALARAWQQLGRVPCVLEQRLPLAQEVSVIVARGADGALAHLPPALNVHREGILAVTSVYPGNIAPALARQALDATETIATSLDYQGVLCVEFFILQDGRLVANEMAPRPHNSGHPSIDACDVSQFGLQVRALAGLPLPWPRQHSPAIMLNLLGDLWRQGPPDWSRLLALPGAHLHLYGKAQARDGRKMGHLTLTADSVQAVQARARQASALLGLPPPPDAP